MSASSRPGHLPPLASDRVCRVTVPPDVRALSTLSRIDYEDAFLVSIPGAEGRTATEWARSIVEGAPRTVRSGLLAGWGCLGLQLGRPGDEQRVLGWAIRRSDPEVALMGARSRLGFEAEVLFKRRPGAVLFATFVEQRSPLARVLWAGVAPGHQHVVGRLLAGAAARHGGRPAR